VQLVHLNFVSKISEKEVNTCLCCEKLRLKLNKAKLKKSSYEEIIKLLQEEGSDEGFCSHCNLIKQSDCSNNEQSLFSASEDRWINFTSHLSNKSGISHSNLTQFFFNF
jgi:DNA-directed RNA polymerase alpha subunit